MVARAQATVPLLDLDRPALVMFDIDGTLTDRNRRLSLEAVGALRLLEASGIRTGLASGNILPTVISLASLIGCQGPLVGENGGVVYSGGRTHELGRRDGLQEAAAILTQRLGLVPLENNRCRFSEVAFHPTDRVQEAADLLSHLPVHVQDTGFALHVMPNGVDKAVAVAWALERQGLGPDRIAAIGDGPNDIPLLRFAPRSGAPADAPAAVREAATDVATADHALGTVELLGRWGLLPRQP